MNFTFAEDCATDTDLTQKLAALCRKGGNKDAAVAAVFEKRS